MKRLTYLSIAEIELAEAASFMRKDSQVWEDCFSTPFGKLASEFASIRNGGLFLKRPFAVVAWFLFRIGCSIGNCRIGFKSFLFFTSAAIPRVGKIV